MLDDHKLLATSGDHASRTGFSEFIEKSITLKKHQTDLDLSMHATAHFIRREIAKALRSRGPVQCNSILAGMDGTVPSLYYLDYLGSLQKLDFAAQGYVSYFALSILDKEFRSNLSREEAKAIMLKIIGQLKERFLLAVPSFVLKVVSADGIDVEVLGEM